MKLYFTTIFDNNYLSRGLSLLQSIKRWHTDFVLYIVCLDEQTLKYFSENRFDEIQLISLNELEKEYPELRPVKEIRSNTDYIFTLSPFYPSYILRKNKDIPFICSLDCDQFFFGNTEFLFKDLENSSVFITPHRFSADIAYMVEMGIYNVSFQIFKNDEIGNRCLSLWRGQCLDWCGDFLDGDRFADQKYLDTWQTHFGTSVKTIGHIGVGLAPWNIKNYKLSRRGEQLYVDDQRLILFHYQGLRFISNRLVQSGLANYNARSSPILVQFVLLPIINSLLFFQNNKGVDSISRNQHLRSKTILGLISTREIFYIIRGFLVKMDYMFKIRNQSLKLHGLFNKLKNIH